MSLYSHYNTNTAKMRFRKLLMLLCLVPLAAAAQKGQIQWMTIEDALKASEKNPKKILVNIYTDWCGWCKAMESKTYPDSTITSYISKNYYAVMLNAEKQPEFTYKGYTYKLLTAGTKSMNEFVLAVTDNKPSFPTVAFIDENRNMLTVVPGYQKPESLYPILRFLGEDKYKTMKFEEFLKETKP